MDTVNTWHRLSAALKFYGDSGYAYKDVPWAIDHASMMITCPAEEYITNSDAGCLVGSAEQSFLHMARHAILEPGKYQAITPCFRHTDALEHNDALHKPYFMKVELIDLRSEPFSPSAAVPIMMRAREFFMHVVPDALVSRAEDALRIVHTEIGYDLELNGIEIGSYGVRSHGDIHWVYATGIAEPRFTQALKSLTSRG